jgi:hypothetical protein
MILDKIKLKMQLWGDEFPQSLNFPYFDILNDLTRSKVDVNIKIYNMLKING